jgi:hypothetical protein
MFIKPVSFCGNFWIAPSHAAPQQNPRMIKVFQRWHRRAAYPDRSFMKTGPAYMRIGLDAKRRTRPAVPAAEPNQRDGIAV